MVVVVLCASPGDEQGLGTGEKLGPNRREPGAELCAGGAKRGRFRGAASGATQPAGSEDGAGASEDARRTFPFPGTWKGRQTHRTGRFVPR